MDGLLPAADRGHTRPKSHYREIDVTSTTPPGAAHQQFLRQYCKNKMSLRSLLSLQSTRRGTIDLLLDGGQGLAPSPCSNSLSVLQA